ncbi:TolC family outer membrane protein [Stenotrophomonas maltophilia]|nr:TolC family outer membrane protein [Stenotrophomonas maltophilia]MBN4961117.1 TolC family outer membrane protein [Stenotrophomonas maltophilia]
MIQIKPTTIFTAAFIAALVHPTAHAEDLMDTVSLAINADPTLAEATASTRSAEDAVKMQRAAMLPQVSLGMALEQRRGGDIDTRLGRQSTRDIEGTVTQPVIDVPGFLAVSQAKSDAAAAAATMRDARQDFYLRVATAYVSVLLATDSLDTYLANEDAYRRQYDQTRIRFDQQLSAEVDMNQAKAYYLSVQSQRIDAENALEQARQHLATITGSALGDLERLRSDYPLVLPEEDLPRWLDTAASKNAGLAASERTLEAAETGIRAARSGHLPKLQLSYSYGKSSQWYELPAVASDQLRDASAIGLRLTVPLYSGGAVHAGVRKAIAERDVRASQLEAAQRQVKYEVSTYFRALRQGIAQVEASREAVGAAEASVKSMQMGYEIGTQNLTNLVVAIGALADSQGQYSRNRHEFVLNSLRLKRVAGTLSMQDLEELNRWLSH